MGVLCRGEIWNGAEQPSWCGFGRDSVGALMPSSSPHPWSCCVTVELQQFDLNWFWLVLPSWAQLSWWHRRVLMVYEPQGTGLCPLFLSHSSLWSHGWTQPRSRSLVEFRAVRISHSWQILHPRAHSECTKCKQPFSCCQSSPVPLWRQHSLNSLSSGPQGRS